MWQVKMDWLQFQNWHNLLANIEGLSALHVFNQANPTFLKFIVGIRSVFSQNITKFALLMKPPPNLKVMSQKVITMS
jgi:hypothetical protein